MLDKIEWLWKYYRKYLYVLFVLLVFTPIQTVFQVSIPRMIDYTIDYLDTGEIPDDFLVDVSTQVIKKEVITIRGTKLRYLFHSDKDGTLMEKIDTNNL